MSAYTSIKDATKYLAGYFLSFFVNWHLSHVLRCSLMCSSIPGHQYDCRILSLVLYCPLCPYMTFPWTSSISGMVSDKGSTIALCAPPCLLILIHRMSFSMKHLFAVVVILSCFLLSL